MRSEKVLAMPATSPRGKLLKMSETTEFLIREQELARLKKVRRRWRRENRARQIGRLGAISAGILLAVALWIILHWR